MLEHLLFLFAPPPHSGPLPLERACNSEFYGSLVNAFDVCFSSSRKSAPKEGDGPYFTEIAEITPGTQSPTSSNPYQLHNL